MNGRVYWLVVTVGLVLLAPVGVQAQPAPIPSINVDMHVDSGAVSNNLRGGGNAAVVFSTIVNVDNAPWLRLRFGEVQLSGSTPNGTGSILRITSLEDGGVQYLDAVSVAQWRYTSAYFNGDKVRIELLAYPNTGPNRLTIDQVTAGTRGAEGESCQPVDPDNREPVASPAHARVLSGCCAGTAFLINDEQHCFLTAGHVADDPPFVMEVVQFNVPLSDPDGTINSPLPQYQFAIDQDSIQFTNGGIGDDWSYFGAFPNSNTGLTPYQEQGLSMTLATTVPPPDGDLLVVTGYGADFDDLELNLTLQTENGIYDDEPNDTTIFFDDIDVQPGNSGSALIKVGSGLVIGIVAQCNVGGGPTKAATRIDNAGLQAALANPLGVCAGGTQEGDHLTIESMTWDDPGGDGDGVPEPGESGITLEVCLNSTAEVAFVVATLTSFTGEPDIGDPLVDYRSICSGCTDCGEGDDFGMDLPFPDPTYVGFTLHVNYLLVDGPALFQEFNFIKFFGGVEPEFVICEIVFDDETEGCSNGDYMLQSGEHADVRIQIRNVGEVTATNVDVCLEPIEGFNCFNSHCISYPNLPPGGPCEEPTFPNNHWDICIPRDVEGTFYTDIIIHYGSDPPVEVTLPAALVLHIDPAAWLEVKTPNSGNSYDFGVAGTNELIEIPMLIENAGNAVMNVTEILTSHSDTTWSGPSLPFDVDPGEQVPITVLIDTSQTPLGAINRSVFVVSDAHVCDPGQDDYLYITGFVGEAEVVHTITTPQSVGVADVSGNIIVYSNNRFGNWDIFAYDLATGEELQITDHTADQVGPRISGSLVAWTDHRNGQADIYAYDLATDCEFVVSAEPANERLFGVDGNYIAFRRQYYAFDQNPCNQQGLGPYNLYVYRYDGGCPADGEICQVTFYPGNDQNQPMQDVGSSGDFGGGTVVWSERTYNWNGACWGLSGDGIRTMEIAGNNPCAAPYVELPCVVTVLMGSHADSERIVYHGSFPGFNDDQIGIWQNDDCQQITFDPDNYNEEPAIGDNLIVYWKQSTGLFYWDLTTSTEHLITTEFAPPPRRMDGNVVVWAFTSNVLYSFLKEADISVNPEGISFSNDQPYAGEEFDVSVQVNNIAPWGTGDDITVELYDGHPQAGGILLASQVIFGGMDGQSQEVVTFLGVVINTPQPHDICVRVIVPSGDNPANNIACKLLELLVPGACCFQDGTCDEATTPDQCAVAGGIYQGDGSTCPAEGCPVTVGACCLADDTCVDGVTQDACMAAAGTYQGDGSDCATVNCDPCPWDLDANGSVGASDLLSLLASWGPCKGCPADFDDSGSVGASDLLAMLANWGPCP